MNLGSHRQRTDAMASTKKETARLTALERENERLRRSVQELSLLNDLAREIGASLDAGEITHKIVRRALKNVKAEQGIITLIEEREGDPMTTLVRTAGSSVQQDPYQVNDSLLGWMLHHKKPLVINDPPSDIRFRGTRWKPSIRSILCVPLLIRSRLTGMLTVYNKKAPTGFADDDQRLLSIIAAQSAQIIENARLFEEEQAYLQIREEVRLAHEIQTSLLPKFPPQVPGYDIVGISYPAETVGGDYFDYIPLSGDHLGLCVGDVSGKGLPASLVMANVQATLRGQAPWAETVHGCLERANRLLCQSTGKGTFVTLFYGILDPRNHQLTYANAGHNKPLLYTAGGEVSRLELGSLVLGFLPDHLYNEDTLALSPGDTLLIYSDGLNETMNTAHELFGEERIIALLKQHGRQPAQTLIDRIVEETKLFAGKAAPHDDLTLLVVKRVS